MKKLFIILAIAAMPLAASAYEGHDSRYTYGSYEEDQVVLNKIEASYRKHQRDNQSTKNDVERIQMLEDEMHGDRHYVEHRNDNWDNQPRGAYNNYQPARNYR